MGKNRFHKIIDTILLAIFLCYFASVTLFYHCHTIDGVTIIHSHFYCSHTDGENNKNKTTDHEHSAAEINLIEQLSIFTVFLSIFFFSFKCFITKTFIKFICKEVYYIYNNHFYSLSLRAPPSSAL